MVQGNGDCRRRNRQGNGGDRGLPNRLSVDAVVGPRDVRGEGWLEKVEKVGSLAGIEAQQLMSECSGSKAT